MPYSFTKIEEDKTRTIGFVFLFLILFYFVSAWILSVVIKNLLAMESVERMAYVVAGPELRFYFLSLPETFLILLLACAVGAIHWFITAQNLIPRILKVLSAGPVNLKDSYHHVFQNIIDEVSVATGGKKMEGVVVPVTAMNAFALTDFSGRSIIGVTEGLLAKLSRAQLEAVVGHEAAHLVTGDCLATTMTSSLFKIYGSAMTYMNKAMGGGENRMFRSRASGSAIIIYLVLAVINFFGMLLNMFISRQREFRADSVAVRLTRDPLSLAEALYLISHRWRGASLPGEELDAIFIINPRFSRLDEKESIFADLFSTHPPVQKRLDILLDMAHADAQALEQKLKDSLRPRQIPAESAVPTAVTNSQTQWLVHNNGQWLGPFFLREMTEFSWLTPETWIKKMGAEHIARAYEDNEINQLLRKAEALSAFQCPRCRVALMEVLYEGAPVYKCVTCYGILLEENDVSKVLAREEMGFSKDVIRESEILKNQQKFWGPRKISAQSQDNLTCPGCKHVATKMVRMFYSAVYPIEIDKCIFCGKLWFDRHELEILQYRIEENRKLE
ncbi:MAG: M48 family metalloprotease [Candidatus Omnitrophota bacterium]